MAATLEHTHRADEIAVHIGKRRLDAVAHARLSTEVHDTVEFFPGEQLAHSLEIRQIELLESKSLLRLEKIEARMFQGDVVIFIWRSFQFGRQRFLSKVGNLVVDATPRTCLLQNDTKSAAANCTPI
jgi:hypothetical protein